jgi:hypothetical protein
MKTALKTIDRRIDHKNSLHNLQFPLKKRIDFATSWVIMTALADNEAIGKD